MNTVIDHNLVSEVKKAIEDFPAPEDLFKVPDEEIFRYKEIVETLVLAADRSIRNCRTRRAREQAERFWEDFLSPIQGEFELILEEARVREARNDPNKFIEYAFVDDVSLQPFKQGKMHIKWQTIIGTRKQILIIAPRFHGKSGQIVGRLIWELGKDRNLRIKIVSNDEKKAGKRIGEIGKHIENNPKVHRVFPDLRPANKQAWNNLQLYVERDHITREPSVEGYGVLSGGTGDRCDILILDDVVDRKNALTQPSLRSAVKTAVKTDWLALLNPEGGWCVSICTLWHKDDVNHDLGGERLKRFLKGYEPDQSGLQEGEWFISFDAVGADFEPVWPEKWPVEKLKAKRRQVGLSAFNRGWRNQTGDDEAKIVKDSWIYYFEQKDLPPKEELLLITSYDLAISTKEAQKRAKNMSSWFACVLVGLAFEQTELSDIFVLDAYRRKIDFPTQLKTLHSDYLALKPSLILVESVSYQKALAEMAIFTHKLPIMQIVPKESKDLRLEACTPLIEAGIVKFSQRLNPMTSAIIETRGNLIGEILDSPVGETDDLKDAFSQVIKFIQEKATGLAIRYSQKEDPEARWTSSRGGVRIITASYKDDSPEKGDLPVEKAFIKRAW